MLAESKGVLPIVNLTDNPAVKADKLHRILPPEAGVKGGYRIRLLHTDLAGIMTALSVLRVIDQFEIAGINGKFRVSPRTADILNATGIRFELCSFPPGR